MVVPNNKYKLFSKVVLASVHQWVSTHQRMNDGVVPDILVAVSTKGYNMKAINGFTDNEIKLLKINNNLGFSSGFQISNNYMISGLYAKKN